MRGPCAKKQVRCELKVDDKIFIGENDCANPQSICPRKPDEGYQKCTDICGQSGHAEIQALRAAGELAYNSHGSLYGHHYVCQSCGLALKQAGVKTMTIVF